jgi:hypothetical protein
VSVSFSARSADIKKYPPLITRSPDSQREWTKTTLSPGSLAEEFVTR